LGELAGRTDVRVDRFDDPHSAVNGLAVALQSMGFVADFAPVKLRQGWGEPVCRVLNFLSDAALRGRGFKFLSPDYSRIALGGEDGPAGGEEEEMEGEIEDEVEAAVAVTEEEALYTEAGSEAPHQASAAATAATKTDAIQWAQEVERMAPRLRSGVAASGREWRSHLEQTRGHHVSMGGLLEETNRSLSTLTADSTSAIQRVQAKEKFLNTTFVSLLEKNNKLRAREQELSGEHRQRTNAVASLTSEIGQVTDEMEEAKSKLDEEGSSMTDQTPLVRIKAALGKLRSENRSLDLRIGVSGHALMQRKLRAAAKVAAGGSARGRPGDGFDVEDEENNHMDE
jgi:intraflagellar transport protein 57